MTRLTSAARSLAVAAAALLTLSSVTPAAGAQREPRAPGDFVALRSVDPTIIQEMRYPYEHNFTGAPVDGYDQPLCILTRPAAQALHRAQTKLRRRGYSLKVYDCYRPQRAVDNFVRWAEDPDALAMKAEFYPRVDKSRLFADGYIAEKSGHSRGSTMDLTLVKLPALPTRPYRHGQPLAPCYAPKAQRFPDNSIDMGTGFDCFDTLAHRRPADQGRPAHQSRPAADHPRRRRLRQPPRGVVALHLPAGGVPRPVLRLPGRVALGGRAPMTSEEKRLHAAVA